MRASQNGTRGFSVLNDKGGWMCPFFQDRRMTQESRQAWSSTPHLDPVRHPLNVFQTHEIDMPEGCQLLSVRALRYSGVNPFSVF